MLSQTSPRIHRLRALLNATISGVLTLSPVAAIAQGVPHLSVDKTAYHTLLAPGTIVTEAMCPSGSSLCLASVGKPLISNINRSGNVIDQLYAADGAGNVYAIEPSTSMLVKITPTGQPTILAGGYEVSSSNYPAVTSSASSLTFDFPNALAADQSGNVYIQAGFGATSTVVMIDPAGVAHRLTAPSALATAAPVEGALASTQYVNTGSITTDAAGNLLLSDISTCTVRKLSKATGELNTVVGTLGVGCASQTLPVAGQKASSFVFGGAIAVDASGTLYFTDRNLYSITTDGIIHLLALGGDASSNTGAFAVAGPAATTGNIGLPNGRLVADPAGNVYLSAAGFTISDPYTQQADNNTNIVEVTKGTAASPSQVLILSTGVGSLSNDEILTLNPEGMPANLVLNLQGNLALDPAGRINMTTQNAYTPSTSAAPFGIAYFDRNGSAVFNSLAGKTGSTPSGPQPQVFTLTNSGSAPLITVNVANTGYPYYLVPTAGEILGAGATGPAPFGLDQTTGTCLAKFAPTRSLTLQPGESCTLAFDYTPNPNIPQAGAFTLYTNDPRGPLTVALSATPITPIAVEGDIPDTGTYYGLDISSTILTPSSSTSSTGSFTISAAVASSVYNPSYYGTFLGGGNSGLDDVPVTPTGHIYAAVSNNATGVVTLAPTKVLDANGNVSFSFSGLAPGTYSLQGVYQGDGSSVASYSNVQTLTVTSH